MRKAIHSAFWRRRRDRLVALLVAGLALVPVGMPIEISHWLADQFPWAPSWLHWVVALGIGAWQLSNRAKALA